MTNFLFERVRIADGAALFDTAFSLDRASRCQQRLDQGSLAGSAVTNKRDGPDLRGCEVCHVFSPCELF
jgi:hypothetical protein